jgi:hypothetical protein
MNQAGSMTAPTKPATLFGCEQTACLSMAQPFEVVKSYNEMGSTIVNTIRGKVGREDAMIG